MRRFNVDLRSPAVYLHTPVSRARDPTNSLSMRLDGVDALAGHFAGDICELLEDDVTSFLTLPRHRRHLLLALCDSGLAVSAKVRFGLNAPAKTLLRWVYHEQMSPLYPAVMKRLSAMPLPKGDYQRLNAACWHDREVVRALIHGSDLNPTQIEVAIALTPPLRRRTIIDAVPSLHKAHALVEIFELACSKNDRDPQVLARALAAANSWHQIWRIACRAIVPKKLPMLWPGTDDLVPILSADDLVRVGNEFHNCLGARATRYALDGDTSVLVWQRNRSDPKAKAVVVLGRDCYGPFVRELAGYRNEPLAESVRARVLATLAEAGIKKRPSADTLLLGLSDGDYGLVG